MRRWRHGFCCVRQGQCGPVGCWWVVHLVCVWHVDAQDVAAQAFLRRRRLLCCTAPPRRREAPPLSHSQRLLVDVVHTSARSSWCASSLPLPLFWSSFIYPEFSKFLLSDQDFLVFTPISQTMIGNWTRMEISVPRGEGVARAEVKVPDWG